MFGAWKKMFPYVSRCSAIKFIYLINTTDYKNQLIVLFYFFHLLFSKKNIIKFNKKKFHTALFFSTTHESPPVGGQLIFVPVQVSFRRRAKWIAYSALATPIYPIYEFLNKNLRVFKVGLLEG